MDFIELPTTTDRVLVNIADISSIHPAGENITRVVMRTPQFGTDAHAIVVAWSYDQVKKQLKEHGVK